MNSEKRVAVFGQGPGGISVADRLSRHGHDVVVINKDAPPMKRSVYSTSVGLPGPVMNEYCETHMRYPIPTTRLITCTGTDFSVETGDEYFMVDYPKFVSEWEQRLHLSDKIDQWDFSEEALGQLSVTQNEEAFVVAFNGGKEVFDVVVDSTGVNASISRQLNPGYQEEDVIVEYLYGGQFLGSLDNDEIILIWDRLGGNSWVNPSIYTSEDGRPMIDVVYTAWGWKSNINRFLDHANIRLQNLVAFSSEQSGIHIESDSPSEIMQGLIYAHEKPRPVSDTLFPVGEAAGVAKPKSGESFNRSLLQGTVTADTIHQGGSSTDVYNWAHDVWNGDDRFFTFVLTRLRQQFTSNHTQLIDRLGKWYQEGLVDEGFIADMEEYIINGTLPHRLLTRFAKDPIFLSTVVETILNHGRRKIFGLGHFKNKWFLPKVSV